MRRRQPRDTTPQQVSHVAKERRASPSSPPSRLGRCSAAVACVLALLTLLALNSPTSPVPFELPPLKPLPPSTSDVLLRARHVGVGSLVGPESLAASFDGNALYAGLADGRIVRVVGDDLSSWKTIARTGAGAVTCGVDGEKWAGPADVHGREAACGRPLGLRVLRRKLLVSSGDPDEEVLVVADAYSGLLMVSGLARPTGESVVDVLATRAQGDDPRKPFSLLNDVAVTADGDVYFTETSRTFQRRRIMYAVFDGRPDGRLLKWDRARGVAVVVRDRLLLPNGVTPMHGEEGALLLVLNVTQAWEYHPSSDELRHFADFLGTGDNVRTHEHTPSGRAARCYWLGWGSKNALPFSLLHALRHATLLRRLATAILPYRWLVSLVPLTGMLAALDERGELIELHLDRSGRTPWISEAVEWRGRLVLGSWFNPFLAVTERSRVDTGPSTVIP